MNLTYLKKKGFKIVTNWQDCNKNTIFLFDSKNQTKFIKYINLAIKKKCNFVICNAKFSDNIKKKAINCIIGIYWISLHTNKNKE